MTRYSSGRAGARQQSEEHGLLYLGLKENFVWQFDTPEELIPGRWHIAVELFDAASPTDYPFHGTLDPKACIAQVE